MKIRTKFILNYSLLSILLLIAFSVTVFLFSIQHRNNDFKIRLEGRAKSAVKMLIDVPQIDSTLLSIIDDNTLSTMNNLTVNIYNNSGQIVYSYHDVYKNLLPTYTGKTVNFLSNISHTKITFTHKYLDNVYRVEASATDVYGYKELNYLLKLILSLLTATFAFIVVAGFYNSYWSLKPFRKLIGEIESFNLTKNKLTVSGSDELAQLSISFNKLLDQLIKAYEDQRSFVTQVSHELRTPVTSLLGQIEITLNKNRTKEEYQNVLLSTYEDGKRIAQIINSFLQLAEASLAPENIEMEKVRIDELIFSLVGDFKKNYPELKISIKFNRTPDEEKELISKANDRLLKIMFRNLIENAIKYSDEKHVEIAIDYAPKFVFIEITDWGIGISKEELNNVFFPMFRGQNVTPKTGHGLGLTIAQKIADLHKATIKIESELNVGTKVIVKLPAIK